jgi:hypothetical protein
MSRQTFRFRMPSLLRECCRRVAVSLMRFAGRCTGTVQHKPLRGRRRGDEETYGRTTIELFGEARERWRRHSADNCTLVVCGSKEGQDRF